MQPVTLWVKTLEKKLLSSRRHVYHVGGPRTGWSDVFVFRAMRAGNDWTPRFAMYGDMGNSFGISIPPLQVCETFEIRRLRLRRWLGVIYQYGGFNLHSTWLLNRANHRKRLKTRQNDELFKSLQVEAWRGNFDAVFHYGDFAYDLSQDEGKFGDAFMRQIQPIASKIPYMTTVGKSVNDLSA